MTKRLMIQGTMSGAGKSLLAAAFCRIFTQDGSRVAPFKSQNMALNSYITLDGLEMGRAQVVQARASGKEPDVRMNPVLLKPSSDVGSQVIVNGKVRGTMKAADYFGYKTELWPDILEAYHSLASENDILVLEGAGSPAEINLRDNDIVNMGLAEQVNAPVLLVGDIDPGGVFAQLYGTVELLRPEERARVKGFLVNKFRGDPDILTPGLRMIEEKTGIPVLGTIPYLQVDLDDEDSLAPRLNEQQGNGPLQVAVIRFPWISNFTDTTPLAEHPMFTVRYVTTPEELKSADLILLPGTKSTLADLAWLKQTGLAGTIQAAAESGTLVFGVCGGFQMLGRTLRDPDGVEGGGQADGLGLLPVDTVFEPRKTRTRVQCTVTAEPFSGAAIEAYEIHNGSTTIQGESFSSLPEGCAQGNVYGTYLHGLFDTGELVESLAEHLCTQKGIPYERRTPRSHFAYEQEQLDLLADAVRRSVDLPAIYRILEEYA